MRSISGRDKYFQVGSVYKKLLSRLAYSSLSITISSNVSDSLSNRGDSPVQLLPTCQYINVPRGCRCCLNHCIFLLSHRRCCTALSLHQMGFIFPWLFTFTKPLCLPKSFVTRVIYGKTFKAITSSELALDNRIFFTIFFIPQADTLPFCL